MNKIEKLLRKIKKREQQYILLMIRQLKNDYSKVPGVKKILGHQNLFRVRIGNYRIIFKIYKDRSGEIIKLKRRDDNTYKNLD